MSETTTEKPVTLADVESKVKDAQTAFDAANSAYKAEMSKGADADDDSVERLINDRKRARVALESANAEVTRFKGNQAWQSLVGTLRPVNKALADTSQAGLPTAEPVEMAGTVNIASDGAVTVDANIRYTPAVLDDLKAQIRTLVEGSRDAFKAQGVTGFGFKVVKGETGWAPQISPLGAAGTKKTSAPVTGGTGGKGSNEYVAPDGTVHTAREAIAALRSTYGGAQQSIDNALATGNAVRNIAVALCEKNGWTIRKAS